MPFYFIGLFYNSFGLTGYYHGMSYHLLGIFHHYFDNSNRCFGMSYYLLGIFNHFLSKREYSSTSYHSFGVRRKNGVAERYLFFKS